MKGLLSILIILVSLVGSFQGAPIVVFADMGMEMRHSMGVEDCSAMDCSAAAEAECLRHCLSNAVIFEHNGVSALIASVLALAGSYASLFVYSFLLKAEYRRSDWYPPRYLFQTVQLRE